MADQTLAADPRRRSVRRMAVLLGVLAVAVYAAYILFLLRHGHA